MAALSNFTALTELRLLDQVSSLGMLYLYQHYRVIPGTKTLMLLFL
jgi:hypothetical protein